jgi:cystathionine beta-synthase
MIEKGYMASPAQKRTVRDLVEFRGARKLITLDPEDTAEDAINLFRKYDISQIPVVDEGKLVGGVREITLAKILHDGQDPRHVSVGSVMARALATVDENTDLEEVYRLLMSGTSAVVVRRGTELIDIIARIDMVDYWETQLPQDRAMPVSTKR